MAKKTKITKKPSLPGYYFGQADETLTKGAATAGGLKKEEPVEAAEMSAFNLKPLPSVEENPGIHKLSKDVRNNMGYQMKYQMVNKKGFEMAGSPKKMAAFQLNETGKTTKETVSDKKVEKKTVPGEEKIVKSKEKSKGSYKSVYDTFETNDKGQKINPRNKKVYSSVDEFIADAKANPAKEKTTVTKTPDKVVETVTKTPVYQDKTMFNIDEQRERGQQSLLAGRQSKREGLADLVAQKAGLKTALKSAIDQGKISRKEKRQAMRSFRRGNYSGLKDNLVNKGVTDLRGFDVGASDLARRQATGVDKSVRYYDTQSAIDKGVRAGGTYSDQRRTTQAEADFNAENNPFSATNSLMNKKLNSGFSQFSGFNMKKGNYMKPMNLPGNALKYFSKKNKK